MNWDKAIATGSLIEVEYKDDKGQVHKMKTLIDHPLKNGYFTIYAPMQHGVVFAMHEGNPVDIFFMMDNPEQTEKDIYKLNCKVEQRGFTNNIAVYKLSKVGNAEKQQRRGAFRLPILREFKYTIGEDPTIHHLNSTNISITGMKAVGTESIPAGTKFKLTFDNDIDNEQFEIQCSMIGSTLMPESMKNYELRIQFENLDAQSSRKINNFLYKKQSEFIAKNMISDGFNELYKKIYQSEEIKPEVESMKKIVTYINIAVFALMLIELTALFYAMPKDPQTIFRILLKMNVAYKPWNYEHVNTTMIAAIITIITNLIGLFVNANIDDAKRSKIHVPLLICLIINLLIFIYVSTAYFMY